MNWALVVVLVALAVGASLLGLGLARPLTARLGLRNAWRHRRQTLTVVVGLLTGTAIIGASLGTGDSLEAGLAETALAALDELDLLVRIPGNLYVSERLANEIFAAPLPDRVEGTSRTVLETAAVEHPAEDLYEPTAAVVGFDPEEDRPFGPFRDTASNEDVYGTDLGPNDAYINKRLADKLDAESGDEIQLRYARPLQPLLPKITWFNGTLAAASGAPSPTGTFVYTHSVQDVYQTEFTVPDDARGIIAIAVWPDSTNTTDLDLELFAPGGRQFQATNGTSGAGTSALPVGVPGLPPPTSNPASQVPETGPQNPAILQLNETDMEAGVWTFNVHAKAAVNQPFFALVAVLVPEYDLQRALSALGNLEETFGGGFTQGFRADLESRGVGETQTFTVRRVVAMEGKAVFFNSDVVFIPRATVQSMYGVEGQVNWLKVTNRGDARGGLEGTTEVTRFFEDRLAALDAAAGSDPSSPTANLVVDPLKQEFLERTEEAAGFFTQFLALIGSFTLIAGIMLIVNIFSMLAEERRHELGIARAVGLTRRDLVFAFTFEGSLYTLAASALGVLAGLGLSAFLIWGINSLAPDDSIFVIPFRPKLSSLGFAFAAGALITFATVAGASYRASRLNIVSAIRDLDDPPRDSPLRRWWQIGFAAVLAVLTVVAWLLGSFLARTVLPALVLFALGPFAVRRWGDRAGWIAVSLAVIGYTLLSYLLFAQADTLESDLATVLRGLVLVIAGTVALVHVDAAPRGVAWLLGRSRRMAAMATVGTTYPLHRRFRTGLTLSMYALVILVIVIFSTFFTMFIPDVTQETGGYQVVGDSQVPAQDLRAVEGIAALAGTPDDPFLGVERVDTLVEHFEFGDERIFINGQKPDGFGGNSALFYGFDADFAANNQFELDEWDADYGSTERAVWERVAADPGLVVVSFSLVGNASAPDGRSFHAGDTLTVNTTGGQTDYIIAAVMAQTYYGGVWMAEDEVARLFAELDGLYLFRLDEGVDPGEAAKRIERAYRSLGMDVDDIESEAAAIQEDSTRVFQLFQAYLGLGLIVGVASIGIVTSRAVLERRREIGMLKAIGFTKRMVAGAFLVEVLFVLTAAALIGTTMGLAIARAVYVGQLSVFPGITWQVPWGRIFQMLGLALVATVLATLWPVKRAADVPAAEALRTIE